MARAGNRKQARLNGEQRYFGKVCTKHPSLNGERYVSGKDCVGCGRDRYVRKTDWPLNACAPAKEQGLKQYHGKICPKHPELRGLRYTSIRSCIGCHRARRTSKEDDAERMRRWRKTPKGRASIRTDQFRIRQRIYRRLRRALDSANVEKQHSTLEYLGCSIAFFKSYIEQFFEPGWSWDDIGGAWHLDHVRPIASFDLRDSSQMQQCFHYSNFRPMEAAKNIRKSSVWNGWKWRTGKPIEQVTYA